MDNQRNETYLNHPSFGMLYRICAVKENQDIFTTLYAQRLFFVVTTNKNNFTFEPVSRAEARTMVETWMRTLRNQGDYSQAQEIQSIHKRTFQ